MYKMKEETKHSIRQGFETLALGVVCSVWVLSMNQSCSNIVNKNKNVKKPSVVSDTIKADTIKNDTIEYFQSEQRAR